MRGGNGGGPRRRRYRVANQRVDSAGSEKAGRGAGNNRRMSGLARRSLTRDFLLSAVISKGTADYAPSFLLTRL